MAIADGTRQRLATFSVKTKELNTPLHNGRWCCLAIGAGTSNHGAKTEIGRRRAFNQAEFRAGARLQKAFLSFDAFGIPLIAGIATG